MYAVKSIKNKREYMEDCYNVISNGGITVGMVSDGHSGYKVTEHLSANLPFLLFKAVQPSTARKTNLCIAQNIYHTVYTYAQSFISERSGSTLTGFVATPTTVFVFNIGDSRTCFHFKTETGLVNKLLVKSGMPVKTGSFWVTVDHTYANPQEVARVKAAGGKIVNGRLNGTLAMTRSVGDASVGAGLSCEPDVIWVKRSQINNHILMYSDGVYENVKESPHTLFHLAMDSGLNAVVDHAIKSGSQDNITAVLVKL